MPNEANTIDLFASITNRMPSDILYGEVLYIRLELTDRSIIGRFAKVLVENDMIFIMDDTPTNNKVFIFDKQGSLISRISARGQGPNEYVSIYDFFVDMQSQIIGIYCITGRILKYDFNGVFLNRQINLPRELLVQEVLFKDGLIYTFSDAHCPANLCYAFRIFDMDGSLLFEDYPIPKRLTSFPLIGFKSNTIASDGKNIFLNSINSDIIYVMGMDRSFPYLHIDFGRHRMSDRDFSELVRRGQRSRNDINRLISTSYTLFGLERFLVNKDFVYMRYLKGASRFVSIYSRKTGNTLTTQNIILRDEYTIIPLTGIVAVDDTFFFAELPIESLWHLKEEEERLGVADESRRGEFSPERLRRWDSLLRDLNEDDNNMIVAFRLKHF